jgi:MscS family membrane protein
MDYIFNFFEWLNQATFLTLPLPHICKFFGFLLAAWVCGHVLRAPLSRWLGRFTPAEDRVTSERVAHGFERSAFFLIFVVVLKTGAIDVLHLPGWLWQRGQDATTAALALASTILFLQIVEVGLIGLRRKWATTKGEVDEHLIVFMRKGIRVFVVLIAVLVTADNIGFRVTGMIAGLGVGGAALALAAQGLIANLLGTFEIVGDKLFRAGDRIQFDQFDGFVQEVGLRSTKMRALTGEQIITPNRKMAEAQIRNFSRNGLVRTTLVVGLVYETTHDNVQKAIQILEAMIKERSDVDSHQIYLKHLGAYSLDLEAVMWARYATYIEYNRLMGEINLEIKKRFDAAHIEFAFPTQTLHVAQTPHGKADRGEA